MRQRALVLREGFLAEVLGDGYAVHVRQAREQRHHACDAELFAGADRIALDGDLPRVRRALPYRSMRKGYFAKFRQGTEGHELVEGAYLIVLQVEELE